MTGTGSFSRPFATPSHAEAAITDASAAKPYSIFISPGLFTDDIPLKSFISLRGIDPSDRPVLTGTLSLDVSFGDTDIAGLCSCVFTNSQAIDFMAIATPELDIVDCEFQGTVSLQGTGSTIFRLRRNHFRNDTAFTDPSTFDTQDNTFDNSDGGFSLSAFDVAVFWKSNGDDFGGTVTIVSAGGEIPPALTAQLVGSQIGGGSTLTLNGSAVSYFGTAGAIPPTVTLLGGAAAPILWSFANGIGYAPTGGAGVWGATEPSTVANPISAPDSALDRLAAAVSGLLGHAIP